MISAIAAGNQIAVLEVSFSDKSTALWDEQVVVCQVHKVNVYDEFNVPMLHPDVLWQHPSIPRDIDAVLRVPDTSFNLDYIELPAGFGNRTLFDDNIPDKLRTMVLFGGRNCTKALLLAWRHYSREYKPIIAF